MWGNMARKSCAIPLRTCARPRSRSSDSAGRIKQPSRSFRKLRGCESAGLLLPGYFSIATLRAAALEVIGPRGTNKTAKPLIQEVKGLRIGWLAYTWIVSHRTAQD